MTLKEKLMKMHGQIVRVMELCSAGSKRKGYFLIQVCVCVCLFLQYVSVCQCVSVCVSVRVCACELVSVCFACLSQSVYQCLCIYPSVCVLVILKMTFSAIYYIIYMFL